ncbi:rod shape-determining protein MreD [Oscillospiraceae bacterium Marseille-Q3528]|nr:rod shape-determining protein MreD [Oscillospiraceae bacterium Marseille-Q3528]WNV59594.1 rod shape-determining protein MreD [Oscillospiraceae bacterium NTUH-002-81]
MIIICFILQNTVFQALALASISPNLLVILTSSMGLMRGKKEGMLVGFFCGFLVDIFYGDLFGFYALVYMYIGYVNGFFNKIFYDDDIKLPMLVISASEFLYSLIVYVFLFLIRTRFNFGYYFIHIIIPELVYTIVVTLFLYRLINGVNRKLEQPEKRRSA